MAKYVIHKVSFFFTDESLIVLPGEEVRGSVVGTFTNLDEAKAEKEKEDILSAQNLSGTDVRQFFCYTDNEEQIYTELKEYYLSEFNLEIHDDEFFVFPDNISPEQAKRFMQILDVTFHYIMEYEDDEDPADYKDYDQIEF